MGSAPLVLMYVGPSYSLICKYQLYSHIIWVVVWIIISCNKKNKESKVKKKNRQIYLIIIAPLYDPWSEATPSLSSTSLTVFFFCN